MSPATPETQQNRPAHQLRIGLIKAAIWANVTREGMIFNVTFERAYRDGEAWKSSNSFGRDDLLKLAKVADEAHSWITRQLAPTNAKPSQARPASRKVA
jgi:hypothetical protein